MRKITVLQVEEVVSLQGLEKLKLNLETAPFFCFFIFLAVVPFSIAAANIGIGLFILLVLTKIVIKKKWISNFNSINFIGVAMALIYLISLIYSKDHARGWDQWRNQIPILVLPFFITIYDGIFDFKKGNKVFLAASLVHLSITFFVLIELFHLPSKASDRISLFHTVQENGWIYLVAGLLSYKLFESPIWRMGSMAMMIIGVVYFYPALLLLLLIGIYELERKIFKIPFYKTIIHTMMYATFGFLCHWIFNTMFGINKNAFSDFVSNGIINIKFSMAQWWAHPLAGVGLGNHDHAMWNEYQKNSMEWPNTSYSQLLHFLVSTGIIGVLVFVYFVQINMNKFTFHSKIWMVLLVALSLYMPLKSEMSAAMFALLCCINLLLQHEVCIEHREAS